MDTSLSLSPAPITDSRLRAFESLTQHQNNVEVGPKNAFVRHNPNNAITITVITLGTARDISIELNHSIPTQHALETTLY